MMRAVNQHSKMMRQVRRKRRLKVR